jgi:hypothetical protein
MLGIGSCAAARAATDRHTTDRHSAGIDLVNAVYCTVEAYVH